MNLIILIIGVLTIFGAGFGSGWRVESWKNAEVLNKQLQAANKMYAAEVAVTEAERQRADAISERFETELAHLHITNTTINREVQHEIEKTVYGDPRCDVPESGRVLRDAAIDAANAAAAGSPGQPPSTVPANPKVDGAAQGGGSVPSGHGSDRPVR